MKLYFRTQPKNVSVFDPLSQIFKREYVFLPPEEVALEVPPKVALELSAAGMLSLDLRDGRVLDLTYGYATEPGEVLRRGVHHLNGEHDA